MAKFKKKKSPPTPDPKDSEQGKPEENEQKTPPTEKDDFSKKDDFPKKGDAQTDEERIRIKKKLDKLFWIRVGLAILGGVAATFIFDSIEGEERRWASIAFMILIFVGSLEIARNMNLRLPRSDRKKFVTTAIGSFVFLYLFSWIVSYTLVNATSSETIGILPFP